jgi:hypothetical protein
MQTGGMAVEQNKPGQQGAVLQKPVEQVCLPSRSVTFIGEPCATPRRLADKRKADTILKIILRTKSKIL